jgi:hypothetical protein
MILYVFYIKNNMAKYSEQGNKQFTYLLIGEILLLLYSIPEFRQNFKDSLAFLILCCYGPTDWNTATFLKFSTHFSP